MTATMKIYYISGRISGDEHNAKELFRKAKEFLQQLGYGVVNPFDNGLHSDSSWERHLAVDIINMLECDGLMQLEGWQQSRGARLEHEIASIKGMEIRSIKDLGFYDNYHR